MRDDTDRRRNRGDLADQLRRAVWLQELKDRATTGGTETNPRGG